MKQLKIMAILFAVLLVAVISAKVYFQELAAGLQGDDIPAPRLHADEPDNPGTEEGGLVIEVE